jgi:DNA-binding NtrC family response regulator
MAERAESLRIVVIDDEPVICEACRLVLGEAGHRVDLCQTGAQGLAAIGGAFYDLVLLDMKLPDMDGMRILKTARQQVPPPCVIVMTGFSTLANAVEAMKLGAADYLAKPFTDDELMEAVANAFRPR